MVIKNVTNPYERNDSDRSRGSRELERLPDMSRIREGVKERMEARKKQAVLHIEAAIKLEPKNIQVGFRKRIDSERPGQLMEAPHFKVELFQVSPKGHLSEAHPVDGGVKSFCQQLEKLLAPWGWEILAMQENLAPGKYYTIIPIEKLAAELSIGLMGAKSARAWMAEREAAELDKVSSPRSDLSAKGIRL